MSNPYKQILSKTMQRLEVNYYEFGRCVLCGGIAFSEVEHREHCLYSQYHHLLDQEEEITQENENE